MHAHYSSQVIDRYFYWVDHTKQKSGEIRGSCCGLASHSERSRNAPSRFMPLPKFWLSRHCSDADLISRPENRLIKCSLVLSSETLTLLYCALRIRPKCCMLHFDPEKWSFYTGDGGGGSRMGDSAPSFWIFLISPCTYHTFLNEEELIALIYVSSVLWLTMLFWKTWSVLLFFRVVPVRTFFYNNVEAEIKKKIRTCYEHSSGWESIKKTFIRRVLY